MSKLKTNTLENIAGTVVVDIADIATKTEVAEKAAKSDFAGGRYYIDDEHDDYISGDMFGDTNLGLTRVELNCVRVFDMVTIGGVVDVHGFSVVGPSDTSYRAELDLGRLIDAGYFSDITYNGEGAATVEFGGDGTDTPPMGVACRLNADGNSVTFDAGELYIDNEVNTATFRFTAVVRVAP